MKTEVIKPNKKDNNKSILTPVIYLIIGFILASKSNEAIQLLFYIIGILLIVYGLKSFIVYYQNRNVVQYKNINLSIAIISGILGLLLILLSNALEVSIRYILGFFLIYMGVSRLLTEVSFGTFKGLPTISNIVLILLGIFSIFVSNAFLVIIGWILIINAILLFWEYLKK